MKRSGCQHGQVAGFCFSFLFLYVDTSLEKTIYYDRGDELELLYIVLGIIGFLIFQNTGKPDYNQKAYAELMKIKYPFDEFCQEDLTKYYRRVYRPEDIDEPFAKREGVVQDMVQKALHEKHMAYYPRTINYAYAALPECGVAKYGRKVFCNEIAYLTRYIVNDKYDDHTVERWENELRWLREYQQSDYAREAWNKKAKELGVRFKYPDEITF